VTVLQPSKRRRNPVLAAYLISWAVVGVVVLLITLVKHGAAVALAWLAFLVVAPVWPAMFALGAALDGNLLIALGLGGYAFLPLLLLRLSRRVSARGTIVLRCAMVAWWLVPGAGACFMVLVGLRM
jgi:hypothetical protein